MAKAAFGLIAASLVVVLAAAQDHTIFRTGASFVHVDVFPTIDGAPVGDLRQDEFEILEDKVPQRIATFEHVVVRGATAVDTNPAPEPTTRADTLQAMQTGHGRVFVLFLDPYHVELTAAARIRESLVRALDRALGPDDLIAVMRPGMNARDLTFTPRHATADAALTGFWGQRDSLVVDDPIEDMYRACYPPNEANGAIAEQMIERRREQRTLSALRDLIDFLGPARDERKAVLVVTDGWRLLEPDDNMSRPLSSAPSPVPPTFDPRRGVDRAVSASSDHIDGAACERDRFSLAQMEDTREMRDIEQDANRGNISFYPIDPRGLVAYDENPSANPQVNPSTQYFAAPAPAASPRNDRARITERAQSLRSLAENTDGLAILGSNNIAPSLRKMTDDLSSYYLLGYNSTGKLDGKFHAITVRVTRAGVDVRARRGYLALNASSAAMRSTAAASQPPADTAALSTAIASLRALDRDEPLHVRTASAPAPDGGVTVWAAGNLEGSDWQKGAEIDIQLLDGARQLRATTHLSLAAGTRSYRARLAAGPGALPGGLYSITVRARGTGSAASATASVAVREPLTASGVLLFRRGASTANRDVPTGDARFRRIEQLRLELPTDDGAQLEARLLDRNGRPLPVPIKTSVREDADGSQWDAAQLSLAPFAPGDYVIELTYRGKTSGGAADVAMEATRTLVPFRIVP